MNKGETAARSRGWRTKVVTMVGLTAMGVIMGAQVGNEAWAQTMEAKCFGYSNPVIPGFHPDPSVCRVDSDYYLVTSTFEFFPGVPVFHSRDLIHWEQIGHCLTRESQLPLKESGAWGGIYAPTIRYHEGRFYMITTNVGGGGNFIVHTEDPRGEWSEPVWLKQQGIDPSLFWDEDGTCYMVSNPDVGIWLCKIDPLTGEQKSESKLIWEGTGGRHPEAPHIYKKDGWYYLMIAEGGTEYGHTETIARSRRIDGPYLGNPSNPILTHRGVNAQSNPIQGTGHADLVEAHDGSWWMVCLALRPQSGQNHVMGRETYLAPVVWPAGGWPVVNGNGTVDLDMKVSTLPQSETVGLNKEHNTETSFTESKLGMEWNYLRNVDKSKYELKGGALRLIATTKNIDAQENPTWVGRRQQDMRFCAETVVSLEGKSEDDEAGMSIYMKNFSHYDLSLIRKNDGKTYVRLRYRLYQLNHVEQEIETNGKNVTLRIEGEPDFYTFSYSTDGKSFKQLGQMTVRYLSSESSGGFTGAYVALYAQKKSEKSKAAGVFSSFSYKSLEK
ncbi:MAG: glycoside hydrolase family 43 protein [Marinilabiliaceae bacterium]|nr:glycoside hydrolase family 43 protein [Bacteroidales bacterium]